MSATLAHTTYHPAICCWQGSHVLTYLSPVKAQVWQVKDPAFSLKSCAFVARWHPGSSVLRTSQLSIIGDLMPFSGSLPRSAIVSDMAIFEHPTWAHRTAESDGSRSPGGSAWPTPDAGVFNYSEDPASWDARRARIKQELGNGNGAGRVLAVEVRREWPTPAASLGTAGHISRGGKRSGELLLAGLAQAMDQKYPTGSAWPTPLATDTEEPNNSLSRIVKTGRRHAPTHKRAIGKHRANPAPGRLNPRFVEALMGFPDNWTAIDGPPHLDHSTHGSRRGPDSDSDTTGND